MKYPTLQACHAKHRRRDFPPPALSRCGEPSAMRATREASERGKRTINSYIGIIDILYIIKWNISSQYILVGGFNPNIPSIWKNQNVPNHQPVYIYIYIYKCIYIIPNKLINNQQPLIINILIPIYWEYLQRTICIPICASHSLSLSRRLSRLLSESLLVHILASACNSQLACGNHTVSTSLFRCWGSSFN